MQSKRTKQIISILLILGMLLTLLPMAALAHESELLSPLSATVVTTDAQLRAAVSAAPTDGTLTTIQVGADMQLIDTDISIFPGRNILLTSQGVRRTITAPANHRHFFLDGSKLTLNNIVVDGGMTSAEGLPRGGIYVQNHPTLGNGHLTIQSGTVIQRNGFGTGPESVARWAVRGNGTTIIMEDGEISSNFGSVGIAGGTFTMNGGVIRNNTNHIGGGAVRLNQGGGPATFIMNGGTIYGNTAPDGGALWGQAQHTMDLRNGTIRDNTAIGNGGAIYVQQMQTVTTLPAGLYPNLTISSTVQFSGNTAVAPSVPPTNPGILPHVQSAPRTTSVGPNTWLLNNYDIAYRLHRTVTFNLNGGTSEAIPAQNIPDGTPATQPTDPSRPNHSFRAWTTDQAGANMWNFNTNLTADTTLFAQWTADPVYYDVTFNLAGGTGNFPNQTVEHGETATEPTTEPTRAGWTFTGWDHDFSDPVTQSTTITAQWVRSAYTVTFNLAGGQGTFPSQTVEHGETAAAPTAVPTRDGWQFTGWSFDFSVPITQDTTVTAQWAQIQHVVIFNLNDGSNDILPIQEVAHGGRVTEPTPPVREDYDFVAWAVDPDGGDLYDFDAPVVGDLSLYAQWEHIVVMPPDCDCTADCCDCGDECICEEINDCCACDDTVAEPAILRNHAYLIGFEDGTIRPGQPITRAEVATIFFRLLDDSARAHYWAQENPFDDVEREQWFNNAISTLAHAGILHGSPDEAFRPNAPSTRGEFVAMAARFVLEEDMPEDDYAVDLFGDAVGHWAERYIRVLQLLGWVKGDGTGYFRPDDEITRAEVAAGINRMFGRVHESCVEDCESGECAIVRMKDAKGIMRMWSDNRLDAWYFVHIQEATHSTKSQRSECDEYVIWIEILPSLDWAVLERPESRPDDLNVG